MNFGFRSGKSRLGLKTIFGIKNFFETIIDTSLKWVFIIALIIGLLFSFLVGGGTGTLAILGLMLAFGVILTYPIYLIILITGDRSISNVFKLYGLYILFGMLLNMLPLGDVSLLITFGAWVLAIGFIYPNKVQIIDSLLVLFIPMIVFGIIIFVTGTTIIGGFVLGESLTQSIMP